MITGTISGAEVIIARFDVMPSRLRQQLNIAITRLTLMLQRDVKAQKLSGQVLNVRTGTLRRSIDYAVAKTPTAVVGKVSTNLRYGRAHEYGFSGTETVRAHLRTIKQAFGRSINPRTVQVASFTRTVSLPERSFLRSALQDLDRSGRVLVELQAAVRRAAA